MIFSGVVRSGKEFVSAGIGLIGRGAPAGCALEERPSALHKAAKTKGSMIMDIVPTVFDSAFWITAAAIMS
ncbi:MAG TPA: hypothetical protein VLA45_13400, partial [Paracoccaceae bacterium]|nr:hypothetical protein [Paracoccaceae bacterium]